MGKAINADIAHGRGMWLLPGMAGHAQRLAGLQGSSMCEQGLFEATLLWGLWSHLGMARSGGSRRGACNFSLPPARPVAKCAWLIPHESPTQFFVSPPKRPIIKGNMEG